jgi:hypothetical protein
MTDNINNKLLELYTDLLDSNRFSLDPIVMEFKTNKSKFYNKYEFTLEDNTNISISKDTYLLCKKYINNIDIITYMNESKGNFMNVIKELI